MGGGRHRLPRGHSAAIHLMKKCTYCGKENPDDAVVCSVDGQPLESVNPPPLLSSATVGQHHTVKRLAFIEPVGAGMVLAMLSGVGSLIVMPFVALFVGSRSDAAPLLGILLLLPVVYAVVGFVCGLLSAMLYNLVAQWTGGLEFRTRDVPAAQCAGTE